MKNRQSALTSLGTFLKQMWPFRQAPKIEVHACLLWNQAPKWHLKYITFDPMPICNCQGQTQSTRRFPTSNFVGTTTDALLDPPLLVASASRSQRMAHGQAQIQGVCHWPSHHQMHQQVQGSLNQCQQLVSANKWTDLANKVMQTKWYWQSKHGRPCTLDSTLTLTPAAPATTLTPSLSDSDSTDIGRWWSWSELGTWETTDTNATFFFIVIQFDVTETEPLYEVLAKLSRIWWPLNGSRVRTLEGCKHGRLCQVSTLQSMTEKSDPEGGNAWQCKPVNDDERAATDHFSPSDDLTLITLPYGPLAGPCFRSASG
jgi:hypothetical protein